MTIDRVAGGALVLVGLFVLWESRALPLGSLRNPGPGYMPILVALLLAAFGVLLALLGGASPRFRDLRWPEARHAGLILLACAFAAFALERLGYRATLGLTLLFLLRVVERRGTLFSIGFALGLVLATFYLFDTLLRVPLPRGPFGL